MHKYNMPISGATHMTNRPYLQIAGALAILLGAFQATPALANDNSTITYKVSSGDTLIGLAKKYMINERSAEIVQRVNNIAEPTRMQRGTVLRIPRAQLQSVPVRLSVKSVSGDVSIIARGNQERAAVGATVSEGMEVKTGRRSFIALTGTDGALVTLPSQSHARLRSARRYVINNALDVDFEIISGRSSIKAPKLRSQERFRTRTPVAVSAVRGTEFRVGFDPETALATTEVVEGAVAVSDDNTLAMADEGFGVTASTTGVKQPEALLRAPKLLDPNRLQTAETANFSITPVADAIGYRVEIGADAGFLEVLDEQLITTPSASFTDIPNGRYHVRARAVASSGLEGLSTVSNSFRRHRVGVEASVEQSALTDGFKFIWAGQGQGDALYAFQIWEESTPNALLVDELGVSETTIILTDLEDGRYSWRVAALQMVPGETEGTKELVKVWSNPQTLTVQD